MKTRYHETHVLWNKEEYDRLHQRMDETGVKNCSAFIRKMALDGYIVKLDMDDIREMIRLLRNATNNLNQIAKRANAGGGIYGADIADMQAKQDDIWETAKEILARLAAIR
jgi:hypothetical protein